jgi:hypothetical protein
MTIGDVFVPVLVLDNLGFGVFRFDFGTAVCKEAYGLTLGAVRGTGICGPGGGAFMVDNDDASLLFP